MWICHLCDFPETKIQYAVEATMKTYFKLSKSQSKKNSTDFEDFMSGEFGHCSLASVDSVKSTNTKSFSDSVCTSNTNDKYEQLYLSAKENIAVLNSALTDVSKDKVNLQLKVDSLESQVASLSSKNLILENELLKVTSELKKVRADRSKVVHTKKILKKRHNIIEANLKKELLDKTCINNSILENLKNNIEHQKVKLIKLNESYKLLQCELNNVKQDLEMKRFVEEVNVKSGENNCYSDDIRQVVMSLQSEAGVSAANVSKVLEIVSEGLFHYSFKDQQLPCMQTALNMNNESAVISNIQIAESIVDSKNVTLHLDGTSRDHKKVVGHQVTLDDGNTLYLGFTPVVSEDAPTLVDITINVLQKLSECYSDHISQPSEKILKTILSKITTTMSDRAAVMKSFGSKFSDFITSETGKEHQVHFLHCNAHFILGLSAACEKAIASVERDLKEKNGEQIGRDKDRAFSRFSIDNETATNRVIRTTCDVLGPRGDQKNGYREEWIMFCENSMIPAFKSNRFNCFFQAAAATIHHLHKIKAFSTNVLPDNVNLKMKSVNCDVHDDDLMACLCAIALMYLKITGPLWKLLNSGKVMYCDFHMYVKMLLSSLLTWSSDPSELLCPGFKSVFGEDFELKSDMFNSVHAFIEAANSSLISKCLMVLSAECVLVTERQLKDFLKGPFSSSINTDSAEFEQLRHCPLTNLVGESAFSDLDLDIKRKPNRKMFSRSASHAFNRNSKQYRGIDNLS